VDARLASVVVGLWWGSLAAFGLPQHSLGILMLCAAGVLTAIYFLRRHPETRKLLLASALIAVILTVCRVWIVAPSEIHEGEFAAVEFVIMGDPISRQAPGDEGLRFASRSGVLVDVTSIDGIDVRFPLWANLALPTASLTISSSWNCRATIDLHQSTRRYFGFLSCLDAPINVGSQSHTQRWAHHIRAALARVTYESNPSRAGAALLPGLTIGDTSAQDATLERDLHIAGLGHLTAVSGANVAIVVGAIMLLLRLTQIRLGYRIAIVAFAIAAFVIVVRPTPSVVRAAAMALIALWVLFRGSQRKAEVVLLISAAVLLVLDPWLALSWGFALSVAATAGLIMLPRIWNVTASSHFLVRAFATASAAALATMPLLVAMGANPTFATIPANIMAEFLVAPATVSGVIAALSAAIGLEPVALIAAEVGMLSADAIATVARFFADSFLAVSVISVAGVMLAMSALVIFRWPQTTWRIRIVWLVILTFLLTGGTQLIEQRNSFQRIPWRMAICDVGQGDAAVLKSSAGHIVVIDAGPDETAMDDCLDELGVGTVSLFIASHFHADHVGGLRALVQGRSVETVLVSPVLKPSGGAELLQRNLTNKLHFARPGMKGSLADLTWEVLLAPDKISGESGTDINNASVVIKIELASHSILFTGDIEEAAQTQLMQRVPPGQMDVIKVPHHGSRYQHPDLPAWSAAQWGWLSVGRDNDYGHPASETLQQYQAAHIRLYSTSECGNLAWLGESHVVSSRACQVSSSSAMLGP